MRSNSLAATVNTHIQTERFTETTKITTCHAFHKNTTFGRAYIAHVAAPLCKYTGKQYQYKGDNSNSTN